MRGEGIVPVMEVGGNNSGNSGFGGYGNGDWAWIIVLFLIFGYGRNGFGGGFGGNSGGGIGENYVLATDFATIERKLDSISNGICDSTFALNNTINTGFFGVQNSLTQGFAGLNTALLQGNYALASQLADCCCKTQRGIDSVNYNNVINTNALSRQISDCCCDLEKMNMQSRYDAQTYNCNTLQAIDKLGDRIIDRLTKDKIDTLQAENTALRFQASQERQNNYLTATMDANVAEILRRTGNDCPVAAYVVNGPTPVNFPTNCCNQFSGFNNGCGCNNY